MTEQFVIFSLGNNSETGFRYGDNFYPKAVLEKALQKHGGKMIVPRHLQNELEHPQPVTCSVSSRDIPKKLAGMDVSVFMSGIDHE